VSETDAAAMVQAAETAFGGLDALVNNAGLFTTLTLKPFDQISNAEWMRVMEVNSMGPFNCAKAALPALRRSGRGRIVNIASTVPIKGPPNMAHYVASKGAVIAFTRSLARELARDRITVNAIAPGLVQTALTQRVWSNPRSAEVSLGMHPLGRFGEPEDIARGILFLADPRNDWVTGQVLQIDGGLGSLKAMSAAVRTG
jgi:NAD(P)-dependent dehydrogenase (short-subunit alcohol dehydrogenase family)